MSHLILFDIDGTLLRTPGTGKQAFERAFLELFQVPNVWKSINAHGRTDKDIIEEICNASLGRSLSQSEQVDLETKFCEYFAHEIAEAEHFQLMPGVHSLLTTLSALEGIHIGIETGNLQATALHKLKRGAIHDHFTFGGYSSDARERKDIVRIGIERGCELHSLKRDKVTVTVIGDSVNDVHAGLANDAQVIAVGTGGIELDEFRTIQGAVEAFPTLEHTEQVVSHICSIKI